MYKVFFNDRKIVISQKADITLNKSVNTRENLHTIGDVKQWFLKFISTDDKEVILLANDVYEFWKTVFVPSFRMIKAAGGVVVRNHQILFIFRNSKWDLPKGKIDKNELTEAAAIREVNEECSISGHSIVKKLPSTFHIYPSPNKMSKGDWILKETFWFEMEYSGSENGKPQKEENITEIKWFEKHELNGILMNTYENLKQIITLYLD